MTIGSAMAKLWHTLFNGKRVVDLAPVEAALAIRLATHTARQHAEAEVRATLKQHAGIFAIERGLDSIGRVVVPPEDRRRGG